MKNTLPFLLLFLCVVGCSKFGPASSSTSNTNSASAGANKAPATPKKVVDLQATFGKSKDEIKKMISATPNHEDPWLEYELPEAYLTFMFDKKGKAEHSSLRFNTISVGDASISGTDTAEQLASMAGIDIKGITAKKVEGIGEEYELDYGGKKAHATFYQVSGKFSSVIITWN